MAFCKCSRKNPQGEFEGHTEKDHTEDENGYKNSGPCTRKGCDCKQFDSKIVSKEKPK